MIPPRGGFVVAWVRPATAHNLPAIGRLFFPYVQESRRRAPGMGKSTGAASGFRVEQCHEDHA